MTPLVPRDPDGGPTDGHVILHGSVPHLQALHVDMKHTAPWHCTYCGMSTLHIRKFNQRDRRFMLSSQTRSRNCPSDWFEQVPPHPPVYGTNASRLRCLGRTLQRQSFCKRTQAYRLRPRRRSAPISLSSVLERSHYGEYVRRLSVGEARCDLAEMLWLQVDEVLQVSDGLRSVRYRSLKRRSTDCHNADWKRHKKFCKTPTAVHWNQSSDILCNFVC